MTTVNYQISASADDGRTARTADDFSSTTLSMGDWDATWHDYFSFMRFTGVAVPQGATITNAFITLRSGSTPGSLWSSKITGAAADNPAAPTNHSQTVALSVTSASVTWSHSEWTSGNDYNSPNIASVVQEIVNRGGWASGNAMILFWEDGTTGFQSQRLKGAVDYSATPAASARLEITYEVGQLLEPTTDTNVGSWVRDPATGSLASAIADRLDADTIDLISTSWPSTARFKLETGSTPVAGTRTLRARVQRVGAANTAFTITLREGGGTTVGGGTLKGTLSTTRSADGWTTLEGTITDSITNYADLYVEVKAEAG